MFVEASYYYAQESKFFKNKNIARKYFNEHNIIEELDDNWEFRQFLDNRYNIEDVFGFSETEKEGIREEYTDYLFDMWCEDDLEFCEEYSE